MAKPLASLSLDLDNKWSYMKTHGDPGWESFPSYLDVVVPRVLEFLDQRNLKITFFVVGQDAARDENRSALQAIADAGHEIGNHSFHHEPWLHRYAREEVTEELLRAAEAIEHATGQRPIGFRGPGFSCTADVMAELRRQEYIYDASTFPTFLGPLARLYYFFTASLDADEKADRQQLFGSFREGFRPLRPHWPAASNGELLEIPVTTMPILRTPIHASYLLYLGMFSSLAAKLYFRLALALCRATRVEPSFLLHPLDFLGKDDQQGLEFFPAMGVPSDEKLALLDWVIGALDRRFQVVTMAEHAAAYCGANDENAERCHANQQVSTVGEAP